MKQLLRKHGFYVLLTIGISLFFFTTCKKGANDSPNSPIIYTDISPDTVFTTNDTLFNIGPKEYHYFLDLNNDGILDFDIFFSAFAYSPHCGPGGQVELRHFFYGIMPFDPNKIANDYGNTVAILDTTSSISDSSFLWNNDQSQLLSDRYQIITNDPRPCSTGYRQLGLSVTKDGFIGLELSLNNNKYFGWVRLDVTNSVKGNGFRVKDYAYNSMTNQAILAGQTK